MDPEVSYLLEEMREGRLHADLDEATLDKRIVFIDRAARTGLEEGGANTLYLALGFLHWYEHKSSEDRAPRPRAPPSAHAHPAGVREGYQLALADEDPQVNVTLLQKLSAEFDIPVEGLEELDTDESGVDVAACCAACARPYCRWSAGRCARKPSSGCSPSPST